MVNLTDFMNIPNATYEECVKVLHTKFRGNFPQYKAKFLNQLQEFLTLYEIPHRDSIMYIYTELFHKTTPYTYTEAFNTESRNLRMAIFEAINVQEMMKQLGSTRLAVKGIELINREYIPEVNKFKETPFTQIYELHKIDTTKLNLVEPAYALKCWCTSTEKEHWLWISSDFKDNILEAIASTCMVYPSMLGKIKHIIRQGDIYIFEMLEEVIPKQDEVLTRLTAKDYFSLLKSQS